MTESELPEVLPEQLLFLNPAEIYIPPRLRKEIIASKMVELTEGIKTTGQIQPIRVRPIEDDEGGITSHPWALVAGFRRLKACEALGIDVRAVNYANLSEFLRTRIELEENLHRQDMTFLEENDAKARLHELFTAQMKSTGSDWSQAQTAAFLGASTANLSKDLKLARAMKDDPSLRLAASKKAAMRAMEMKENHRNRMAQSSKAAQYTASITSKLFMGDARDFVRSLPAGSVDLVFTDLPYGIDYYSKPDGMGATTKKNKAGLSKYDDTEENARDLMADLVPQLMRVTHSASWIAVMMNEANYGFLKDLFESCCASHFEYKLTEQYDFCTGHDEAGDCLFLNVEEPHWIWYRENSQMPSLYPDRHAQNVYERILVFNRGSARLSYPCPNVLTIPNEYGGERWHAMQKPLTLCKEVISRLSLPGERVLDPTFGSGNLLKAANILRRDFCGSELNTALYELAVASISESYGGDVERLDPELAEAAGLSPVEVEIGLTSDSEES